MHAMILAAGRGERLRPLTDTTPKPMVMVRGKPLIQWHLEALAAAHITEVVINLAHLGDQIQSFAGSGAAFGLNIRYSQEPSGALETAGGIANARPWIDATGQHNPQPFLVINADVFTDWPAVQAISIAEVLIGMKSAGEQSRYPQCHLVLVDNPQHHPLGDFGLDPADLRSGLQRVTRRPAADSLTFSGIGVYDPELFAAIRPGDRAALAPLLFQAIDQGCCVGSHFRGAWSDVGTPDRLRQLNSV
ncbi:MAG: nucleotidyltransferase family protein [Betaproteobacteria bacterium]|nr:nucleotidyltransferase family protein [Betaproteobacteria bacterium]